MTAYIHLLQILKVFLAIVNHEALNMFSCKVQRIRMLTWDHLCTAPDTTNHSTQSQEISRATCTIPYFSLILIAEYNHIKLFWLEAASHAENPSSVKVGGDAAVPLLGRRNVWLLNYQRISQQKRCSKDNIPDLNLIKLEKYHKIALAPHLSTQQWPKILALRVGRLESNPFFNFNLILELKNFRP
jgi:hypothetical protein